MRVRQPFILYQRSLRSGKQVYYTDKGNQGEKSSSSTIENNIATKKSGTYTLSNESVGAEAIL